MTSTSIAPTAGSTVSSDRRRRRADRAEASLVLGSRDRTPHVRHDTTRAGSQLRPHRARTAPIGADDQRSRGRRRRST